MPRQYGVPNQNFKIWHRELVKQWLLINSIHTHTYIYIYVLECGKYN